MSSFLLPNEFSALETLAEDGWCLDNEIERTRKRHESKPEALRKFYDLVAPRLEEIIDYLNTKPFDDLAGADQRLLYLLLSMAEVTFAVEKFGGDESGYTGVPSERFVAAHDLPEGGLPLPVEYRPAPKAS
ncbi:MAG: hypothetical protein AAF384_14705 [Pseudomonadota bacterium]